MLKLLKINVCHFGWCGVYLFSSGEITALCIRKHEIFKCNSNSYVVNDNGLFLDWWHQKGLNFKNAQPARRH